MSPDTLNQALRSAVTAARTAGEILQNGFLQPEKGAETKSHRHDPVTVYDRQADTAIQQILRSEFPDWGIVSEEGSDPSAASDVRWVIDPLDGTNNFLRGVPDFAVSIALMKGSQIQVGCIYDPLRDALYTALIGQGACLNGEPIRVSAQASLDGAVLGVGLSILPARRAATLASLEHLIEEVRALRLTGSAALDLAYVAAGRFDAAWYLSLHPWDVAAGSLLVTEAGGSISDLMGGPLCDPDQGILASNHRIHESMIEVIAQDRSP